RHTRFSRDWSSDVCSSDLLVRRAAGDAELLDATGVRRLDAAPADLVALSADGARLVHVRDGATTVLPADSAGAPPPAGVDPAVKIGRASRRGRVLRTRVVA